MSSHTKQDREKASKTNKSPSGNLGAKPGKNKLMAACAVKTKGKK